jgi:hypothetical protein
VAAASRTLAAKKKVIFRNLSDFMRLPPGRRHSAWDPVSCRTQFRFRNRRRGTASVFPIGRRAIRFKTWALNKWKPDIKIDVSSSSGGDGVVIFVGWPQMWGDIVAGSTLK